MNRQYFLLKFCSGLFVSSCEKKENDKPDNPLKIVIEDCINMIING